MTKDELSNFDNDLTIKIANTFKNIFLSLQNNNTAFKSHSSDIQTIKKEKPLSISYWSINSKKKKKLNHIITDENVSMKNKKTKIKAKYNVKF